MIKIKKKGKKRRSQKRFRSTNPNASPMEGRNSVKNRSSGLYKFSSQWKCFCTTWKILAKLENPRKPSDISKILDSPAQLMFGNIRLFETEVDSHRTALRPWYTRFTFYVKMFKWGYQLHVKVPRYAVERSDYQLHKLVPRYDVHVKRQQFVTTFVVAKLSNSRSEIPRRWISNPCLRRNIQQTVFTDPKTVDLEPCWWIWLAN